MRRLRQTLLIVTLLGLGLLPTSASAQVYGQTDGGNVYRPGTSLYNRLGRSAYGKTREDYAPYNYNGGFGQGAYLPGYGRYSGRSGWGEYSKYRIPGPPR